ncbi:hypothetical protein F7734_33130 [Scytonema sp. UIC 10036]|uniref:ABC transporter permease/M1 family aminopeptidase n=1 Tax=Scytonema sp. UIC 10036 TaxID=2304196 RepID=UPI0012DA2D02|nr:M1 family aminopeptidase [Scytonema sp. UIC 10036]MUG96926.1 hypothetical protein [Scytonema sp. UIC 10036]
MTTHPPIHPSTTSSWRSIGEIIRFELQESLRTRFLLGAFGVFFALQLIGIHLSGTDWIEKTFSSVGTPEPGELIPYVTSPLAIMQAIAGLMGLLMIVVAGIFADRASKDFAYNVDGLIFTTPIKEWQYVTGRLIASFLISLIVSLSLGLALLIGQALPWMEPTKIAPFNLLSYIQPYLYIVLPNLLIFGLFSFALGSIAHRTLPGYLAVVGLMFASSLLQQLFRALKLNDFLVALSEPFGNQSINYTVQFWTKVQQNTLSIPFAPIIWLSRLLFLALSIAFFGWVWQRFSFSGATTRPHSPLEHWLEWGERRLAFWISRRHPEPESGNPQVGELTLQQPTLHLAHGYGAQLRHVWRIALLELRRLIWNPLVLSVLVISILLSVILQSLSLSEFYGTPVLPVTGQMVQTATRSILFLSQLLIIFLAGDLVWRERDVAVQPLSDPLPVRSWALMLGKLLALVLILAVTLVVLMLACIVTQTLNGYTNYELGVYGIGLFTITLVDLFLVCAIAMTIQVVVNQKFLGYFLSAAFIIGLGAIENFPWLKIPQLLLYGEIPSYSYSQINGYGRMLEQVRWFQAYWLTIAILLLCVATLFWVRGLDTQPQVRWRIARQRFTRPMQMVIGLSAITALLLGGWIFYNTQILTPRYAAAQVEAQQIAYEKAYQPLTEGQPKITAVQIAVDLYPKELRAISWGKLTLENRTQRAIDRILINTSFPMQVNRLTVDGKNATSTMPLEKYHVREFALTEPLAPGKSLEAIFNLAIAPFGFTGENPGLLDTSLVENGTFLNQHSLLPTIGFNQSFRLSDNQKREQAGLPKLDLEAEKKSPSRLQYGAFNPDADRIQFSATLSTTPDQIALTTGNLVREWREGDRRYFQYQSPVPILCFFAVLSGRYEVLRDDWNGIPIEVYYQKGHDHNLTRIVRGAKASLDYATRNFKTPYPHNRLRLIEIPYGAFGQSYPGNISFGENAGFLARVNDKDSTSVDYAFLISAHETAHQWWGHQVTPAQAIGANIISESLAEYTAFQVVAKQYGSETLRFALRQNLKTYLGNRTKSDVPLVEAGVQHLIYQKGSLAMYALQDYLGEAVVNRALAKFLQEKTNVPPYPSAQDLVAYLRQVTPEKYQYLIADLFETVTLYDNKAEAATLKPRPDGKYDVTLKLSSRKVRSDRNGNETPVAMNDDIDVGVFNAAEKLIYLQKHRFSSGETELTIAVDERPIEAGIDPLNKLIDVVSDDNLAVVKEAV